MYTKEELAIVEYIENRNPKSVSDLNTKMQKIKSAVTDKYTKRKAINVKVLESDLEKLKARALEEGMPYQTLLNSVLHKYITGQLVDKRGMTYIQTWTQTNWAGSESWHCDSGQTQSGMWSCDTGQPQSRSCCVPPPESPAHGKTEHCIEHNCLGIWTWATALR